MSQNNEGFDLIKHPRLEDKDELLSASWIPNFFPPTDLCFVFFPPSFLLLTPLHHSVLS